MKKAGRLFISPQAREDVQQAIDYYNIRQMDWARNFMQKLNKLLVLSKKTPIFQVRYADVHCCPTRVFPFMVHYTLKDNIISVWGVVNMAKDPEKYWKK